MKNLTFGLIIIALIGLSACEKYENGPSFTLLSATKRITGNWELKEALLNDTIIDLNNMAALLGEFDTDNLGNSLPFEIDPTQISVNSVKLNLESDGDGNFSIAIQFITFPYTLTEYLTWAFDDEKENVEMTISNETSSFEILRLSNKEMWLRSTETVDGETNIVVTKFEKLDD
ncbi:MAG TPA: hypothetical protein PLM49_08785 [Bacteroidales bacterium]|nr:hypothetical protein [Bacteroidales bacterium]